MRKEGYKEEYEELAEQEKYAEAVISLINKRRTVSFVEIEGMLDSYINTKGDLALCAPNLKNVILWVNVSDQFIDIMVEVIRSKKVEPTPTNILTYAFDGRIINLPIAKRPMNYKHDHWLPLVFNPIK